MICKVGKKGGDGDERKGRSGICVMYTPSSNERTAKAKDEVSDRQQGRGSVCIQLTANSPPPIFSQKPTP